MIWYILWQNPYNSKHWNSCFWTECLSVRTFYHFLLEHFDFDILFWMYILGTVWALNRITQCIHLHAFSCYSAERDLCAPFERKSRVQVAMMPIPLSARVKLGSSNLQQPLCVVSCCLSGQTALFQEVLFSPKDTAWRWEVAGTDLFWQSFPSEHFR